MIHFEIYNNIEELPKEWDSLVAHDILLQSDYLKALQVAAPSTISLYFIGVCCDGILVGIAIVQRAELYAKDMFRNESRSKLRANFRDAISQFLKGNILVIGNLTHTGQHGIFFNKERISQSDYIEILFVAIDELKRFIKEKKNQTIRAMLFKDYFENDSIHLQKEQLRIHKFYHVNVQPNMLLQIRPNWHNMSDYFNDLNTKYKTRYKRAKKKLGNVQPRELTLENIKDQSSKLFKLYKNVSNHAAFNTFVLPQNHFYTLKLELKERFRVFGYYLNDDLVGFYTLILNKESLETYFLGYDQAHQYDKQLYLNMLYDMIGFGIENRFKTIVYARTAMEIKSSVGAKSQEMSVYIKHTNGLVNFMLNPIFSLMNPVQNWEERHPFN